MKFQRKRIAQTLFLWTGTIAILGQASAVDLPPANLRLLAAHATQRETWPQLRVYAESHAGTPWCGWAYFVLGYQEFQAKSYLQGAEDLGQAAKTGLSLDDFAVFYRASALREANRAADAATVLQDFASRFPRSQLRNQVLELRVNALLSSDQPQPAIDLLSVEPSVRTNPALALLLGQADQQGQHLPQAAAAFQNVSYNFPLSNQAKAAEDALTSLRRQLGPAYPEPALEIKTVRADALLKGSRYQDALDAYDDLLKSAPSSPMLVRWQLGQARCLVRLHRTADAMQALANHFVVAEDEAQRWALLVQVHAQQSDTGSMTVDLAALEAAYSTDAAYAEALSTAGSFYYRQFDWKNAAQNYQRLWDLFPQSPLLHDDGWRLGWCDYLLGDAKTAEVIHAYLLKFPDSSHAPAALYWLGRVEEDKGAIAEARTLYALEVKRYAHTYYAPEAAAHLATLRTRAGSVAASDDPTAAPLAAALIPVLPPTNPPDLACAHITPSDAARPALILEALDLPNVEQEFLKATVAGENSSPELRLLLAATYAAQGNAAGGLFGALRTAPSYSQMAFSDLPEEFWNLLYPRAYSKLIETQARLNKLDPYLVMGLIRQESAFSLGALSVANARGLMQVMPQTAAETTRSRVRTARRLLYDPNYNVRVGCMYLAKLLKEFDGKPEFAMAAYNAGDFRVKDWMKKYTFRDEGVFLESIPISATRAYVEQVLRDAEVYRQLLSGSPRFAQCSRGQSAARLQSPPSACTLTSGLEKSVPAE